MKIVRLKCFSYSDTEKTEWESALFHPIKDYKFSVMTKDGLTIECATFELIEGGKHEVHACVSSQAGCKFGCKFCTSGKHGFVRNLSAEEIEEQIHLMAKHFGIQSFDHVVYMGIGEPLDNLENVGQSISSIVKANPWYSGKISLCTAGVTDSFNRLLELKLPLRYMWLSLHAATDNKRRLIMPIAKLNGIDQLINTVGDFSDKSGIPTCVNYMILHGFNDLDEDVISLTKLLGQTTSRLKLMITIPNGSIEGYKSGTKEDTKNFQQRLVEAGIKNRIVRFLSAGRPVNAGCGELIFIPQNHK